MHKGERSDVIVWPIDKGARRVRWKEVSRSKEKGARGRESLSPAVCPPEATGFCLARSRGRIYLGLYSVPQPRHVWSISLQANKAPNTHLNYAIK